MWKQLVIILLFATLAYGQNKVNLAHQVTGLLPHGNGGTDQTTAPDHNLLLGLGTGWTLKALSDCVDTAGNHLNYTAATHTLSCGTSDAHAGTVTSFSAGTLAPLFTTTVGTSTTTPALGFSLTNANAFTLFGNNTNVAAGPGFISMDTLFGSCSAATSALTWNTTTHAFGCNSITGTVTNVTGTLPITVATGTTTPVVACPTCLTPSTPLPSSVAHWRDDFLTAFGELVWTKGQLGGASANALQSIGGVWPNIGLVQMRTGATATNGQYIMQPPTSVGGLGRLDLNAGWTLTWIFALQQTTATRFRAGVTLNALVQPAIGLWVRFDTNAPAPTTVANDNASCASAGACRNAGGTIATFTTTGVHGLTLIGQTVTIAAVSDATFNGACVVATIPSTTTFTCSNSGAGSAHSGTGSATPVAETTFKFEARGSSLSTVIDSGVSADTGFHKIVIRSLVAGTILYSMDGGVESSIATNLPASAVAPIVILCNDTAADKLVTLDLFDFYASGLSR